jgi:hypothetical protein
MVLIFTQTTEMSSILPPRRTTTSIVDWARAHLDYNQCMFTRFKPVRGDPVLPEPSGPISDLLGVYLDMRSALQTGYEDSPFRADQLAILESTRQQLLEYAQKKIGPVQFDKIKNLPGAHCHMFWDNDGWRFMLYDDVLVLKSYSNYISLKGRTHACASRINAILQNLSMRELTQGGGGIVE